MARENVTDGYIINIIQMEEIREQSELQQALKAKGIDVPQATLSRRLKKLNIAKVSGVYKIIDFNLPNLPLILNMTVSDSGIVVLHTHPGNANALAYFLDQKYVTYEPRYPKGSPILGTIAGDDTVFVLIKSRDALPQLLKILQAEFPYLSTGG